MEYPMPQLQHPLKDLSDDVRSFLDDSDSPIEVIDEAGEVRYVVYRRPTDVEKTAALDRLRAIQKKTHDAMTSQGITEDDIDRVLQEND